MKRRNGFTLIELLAVIVILAIIAVIAVPIVLNIIDESKENAGLRSAEMYLDAVEMSVAQATLKNKNLESKTYDIMSDGNICLETLTAGKCIGTGNRENNEEDILKVEVNGEAPTSGNITITNGTISQVELNFKDQNTIVKNSDGDLVYQTGEKIKTIDDICTHDTTNGIAPKTAGAKYTCEVKEGTSYTFYVLTTPQSGDTSINLIMDRNICEDGTPTAKGKTCLVAYNSSGDAAGTGPVTAMTFLNNATSTWENIDNLNIEYNDEGGNFSKFAINGKARMPYKNEVSDFNNNNAYLYDYLYSYNSIQANPISGISGYWLLSSIADYSNHAWCVSYNGNVINSYDDGVANVVTFGARPVITLKI